MTQEINVKTGEAKRIKFTVSVGGVAVDVSTATNTFKIADGAGVVVVTVADGSFDKTDAAFGIVYAPLSDTDTTQIQGVYNGELKTEFTATNIDKSDFFTVNIATAIT